MGFALRLWSKNKYSSNVQYLTLNKPEVSLLKCYRIHAITLQLLHVFNFYYQKLKTKKVNYPILIHKFSTKEV